MKLLWAAATASLALVLSAAPAMAVPVQWTVPATPLENGGTIVGTFTYDADTNTYSSVNLRIDRGVVTTHFVRVDPSAGFDSNSRMLGRTPVIGGEVVELQFNQALTNAGGSSTLHLIWEGTCAEFCTSYSVQTSSTVASTVTATPPPAAVPTLSEWAMILLGVMLAGAAALTIHRRRTA